LRNGEPLHVVAYGSSITLQGYYLSQIVNEFGGVNPASNVKLTIIGRDGWDTVFAAFGCAEALREPPDLLFIEFSVNDHAPSIEPFIGPALEGIIDQVRTAAPDCEIAFVYNMRMLDIDVRAKQFSIGRYEAVADANGIPSLDLDAAFVEIVTRGDARYRGAAEDDDALTTDGTHHTPAAARLAGKPFARALLDIIASPEHRATVDGSVAEPVPAFDGAAFSRIIMARHGFTDPQYIENAMIRIPSNQPAFVTESPFRRARCLAPRDLIVAGNWALGEVTKTVPSMYHRPELLIATEPGATFRFACGSFFCIMGFTKGLVMHLTVRIDGETFRPRACFIWDLDTQQSVWVLAITHGLSDAAHLVEVVAETPMVGFTDVFVFAPP